MLAVSGVKVILNAVVTATWQLLGDRCPLIAHPLVAVEDDPLFINTDRILLNVGVQMVMPPIKIHGLVSFVSSQYTSKCVNYRDLPFTTLLASARTNFVFVLEALGHKGPPLSAVLGHQLHNGIILLKKIDG